MQIDWDSIGRGETDRFEGATVEVSGWFAPLASGLVRYGVLVGDPGCCDSHLVLHPTITVEVLLERPLAGHGVRHRTFTGRWVQLRDNGSGWRFQLHEARVIGSEKTPGMPCRRLFLGVAAAAGLSACSAGPFRAYAESASPPPQVEWSSRAGLTVDAHSRAGRVTVPQQESVAAPRPFTPLSAPMRDGGMNVVCLAVVADTLPPGPPRTAVVSSRIASRRRVSSMRTRSVTSRAVSR